MRTVLSVQAFALMTAMPAAAFDFDPSTCSTFLVGTWKGGGDLKSPAGEMTVGSTSWLAVFAADGTYTLSSKTNAEGNPAAAEMQSEGGWNAVAGKPAMSCEITFKPKDSESYSETVTATGPDGLTSADGQTATRQK